MRIQIDYEISPRVKRLLKVGFPIAILFAGSVVYANVPNTFKDGDGLSAQTMNDNFTSVDTRLAKLEAFAAKETFDGGYASGALYCGATGATKGDLSGLAASGTSYAKARGQCAVACSSPGAHMCTSDELIRSMSVGMTFSPGWYSTGTSSNNINECSGWTDGTTGTIQGQVWTNGPNSNYCTAAYAVLCCN